MNRWPSRAGEKAQITSDAFQMLRARGGVSGPRVSVWSACVFSVQKGRLRFDGRAFDACFGTLNPPLTPPRRGTVRTRTIACYPSVNTRSGPDESGLRSPHAKQMPALSSLTSRSRSRSLSLQNATEWFRESGFGRIAPGGGDLCRWLRVGSALADPAR